MSIVLNPSLNPSINTPLTLSMTSTPAGSDLSIDTIQIDRKLSSSSKIKLNREGSLSRLRGLEGMYVGASTATPLPLPSALEDYQLPKGHISSTIAAEIVEVYRRGGRLGSNNNSN
jgi:hypothetical protein